MHESSDDENESKCGNFLIGRYRQGQTSTHPDLPGLGVSSRLPVTNASPAKAGMILAPLARIFSSKVAKENE